MKSTVPYDADRAWPQPSGADIEAAWNAGREDAASGLVNRMPDPASGLLMAYIAGRRAGSKESST